MRWYLQARVDGVGAVGEAGRVERRERRGVVLGVASHMKYQHPIIFGLRIATHNSKVIVSRGCAETNGGSNASVPLLPTLTMCTLPWSEAGVAAGDPGYDE